MRRLSNRYLASLVVLLFLTLSVLQSGVRAVQNSKPESWSTFTVDDMLDVANANAASLSNDGHWLAATTASLRDRIGIDNARFGDPTYVAPSSTDVLIIDTQTTKTQKLFPKKQQVRNLRWSPDSNHLALLVLKGDTFEPTIWDRSTSKFQTVSLPKEWYAAENSDMEWSPDGSQLFLTLHSVQWRDKARAQFENETKGRVVVHSSKEPFLANGERPQLQKFYYELAQANHPGALEAITEIIPITQLLFGTDYPIWRTAESVGGVSKYKGFNDAQRHAVNRGNAERLFPKLKS